DGGPELQPLHRRGYLRRGPRVPGDVHDSRARRGEFLERPRGVRHHEHGLHDGDRPAPGALRIAYGENRAGVLGNGIASRMCGSLRTHWISRSTPIPKPAWGTLPYRRVSRYQSYAFGSSPWSARLLL